MVPPSTDTAAFRAIAHPIRRSILDALTSGEQSVGQLCERFEVTQPAISQHLEVLREAGLVRARAVGRRRLYALDPTPLQDVFAWTARFEAFWRSSLDRLGTVLDREAAR